MALKQQARDALEAGEFVQAETLLNDASAKDLEAAQQLQEIAATRLRSAAASLAANGDLKRTQLAYAEAATYYQQAAELLESVPIANLELAEYLNAWAIASMRSISILRPNPSTSAPWPSASGDSAPSIRIPPPA